jgi:hypothetical protein
MTEMVYQAVNSEPLCMSVAVLMQYAMPIYITSGVRMVNILAIVSAKMLTSHHPARPYRYSYDSKSLLLQYFLSSDIQWCVTNKAYSLIKERPQKT